MARHTHSLWNPHGQRLYLTPKERIQFIAAAQYQPPIWRTFSYTLAHTGCRISEALRMEAIHFDFTDKRVAFETLKQRRRGVWRRVPVPRAYLEELDQVHDLRERQIEERDSSRVWEYARTTAYMKIKQTMEVAGIRGPHANPKGLRHAFAINAILCEVPITAISKWLGHARLETTQIYLNALDQEEYKLAERMWKPLLAVV